MVTVTLKDARQRLGQLVDAVARGEEVVITRRGRRAARLQAVEDRPPPGLPNLDEFRTSLRIEGSLTESLLQMRDEERA
ncbi:MAG: type II toxin-antitoxin system prevent-host-death family antitoxin [Lentisphaeria bacterium]|nr:type II toxin-antitoxin system prevent-host-death family antitoxin [Lentisphaeria bacterium]